MPRIHCADNLEVLHGIDELSIPLCYIDPPFSTGKTRRYRRLKTIADEHGDRVGFAGKPCRSIPQ